MIIAKPCPKLPPSSADRLEDARLMRLVAANDETACKILYDRMTPHVRKVAAAHFPQHTDDFVQEVYVALWKTASSYDSSRSALITWIMAVTRAKKVDRLRGILRHPLRSELPALVDPSSLVPSFEEEVPKVLIQEAFDTLSPNDRAIFSLYYFHDKSAQEVATALQTPLGTVKTAIYRGRQMLRVYILSKLRTPPLSLRKEAQRYAIAYQRNVARNTRTKQRIKQPSHIPMRNGPVAERQTQRT